MSIAEEEGIPFEERCRMAKQHLQADLRFFEQSAEHSLEYQQQEAEDEKRVLGYVQSLPDEQRKKAEDLVHTFNLSARWVEAETKFNQQMWERSLAFSKEVFGTDATDFALKQLKRERPGN